MGLCHLLGSSTTIVVGLDGLILGSNNKAMACFGMCPAVFSPWSFDGPHLFPLLFLVLPMNWFTFPLLFQLIWAWHLAFCLTFLAQKVGASFSGSRVSRRLKIENCSLARYGYFFVLFCFVLFFFSCSLAIRRRGSFVVSR